MDRERSRFIRVQFAAVVALGLAVCIGPGVSTLASPAKSEPGAAALGWLPTTFSGVLPCADCEGIRYQLNIFPDSSFYLRMTYLGHDDSFDDIGSWYLSSDQSLLVLKGGREEAIRFRVVDRHSLRKLDLAGREIGSSLNYTLKRSKAFERFEPRLTMRGMYWVLADAAYFSECLSRQRWPVAQAGENASLEREYLSAQRYPGEKLLVNLEGRIEMRASVEGDAPQPTLVVDRYIGVWPGETCGARFATEALENTYWKLTRLGEAPVFVHEQQREPSLVLHSESHRVTGSTGCNRLMGSYQLNGEKISFGPFAATRMACPKGMDTERLFFDALERVRTWNVLGQHLELYDVNGEMLARFEARPLR
jgi:copper homeostasis protein (lipoprotein)